MNLKYVNESVCLVDATQNVIDAMFDAYSFYAPNYMFHPQFKAGRWDGKIMLFDSNSCLFPVGLIDNLKEFASGVICEDVNVDEKLAETLSENSIDPEFWKKYKFYSKGHEIFPRGDQQRAVHRALRLNRCINIAPTSFGKSLCICMQVLNYIERGYKTLLVVPNVSLVKQMAGDITDYATRPDGTISDWIPSMHCIHAGKSKDIGNAKLTISTWQSIYKEPASWFNQFDAIVLDECHKIKAKCLSDMFDRACNVRHRTGWTGSLRQDTFALTAEARIGKAESVTSTRELMDKGLVANLNIKVLRINYPEDVKKEYWSVMSPQRNFAPGMEYPDEIKLIENSMARNNFIAMLISKIPKTGLVLFNHLKHGESLLKSISKACVGRHVYYITGEQCMRDGVKYQSIEELKPFLERESDSIVLATYGVLSTGVSIKNLHYLIFASPTKSFVRTVQSIGRGLRISDTKKKVTLFDIVDNLSYKPFNRKLYENYCLKHFAERFSVYMENMFSYSITQFSLQ